MRQSDTSMDKKLPLFEIMAYQLLRAKPLSEPVMDYVDKDPGNKFQNTTVFIPQDGFENVIWKQQPVYVSLHVIKITGPWFNIKMSSYQYRKSHCGDKMVIRSQWDFLYW